MKVWVTRNSANSIMFGGLERLFVHFSKPEWHQVEYRPEDRTGPFGDTGEDRGFYKSYGWVEHDKRYGIHSLSVGNWIGYIEDDNPEKELAMYIWTKLKEHFKNADFSTWGRMEANGEVRRKDFLLEIEIKLAIDSKTLK